MELVSKNSELAQHLFDALSPLLSLVHSARSLSPGKVGILRTLSAEGRASAARMSQAIGVSQQAISLTTKELEGLGLIARSKDASDRRKVWFSITEAGQQRLDQETQLGRTALKQAISTGLDEEDLELIYAAIPALKKIKTAGAR